MKKANVKAEVSWQLVTMIIALIVLVIMIYIFTKQSGKSVGSISGFGDCKNQGTDAACVSKTDAKRDNDAYSCYYALSPCGKKDTSDEANEYCCFKSK